MVEDYTISQKDFKNISKWAENVYNLAVVLDYFCYNQPEIEELYNITPIVKYLRQDADSLNAFFIDIENKN